MDSEKGRILARINNSDGMCLLENWVEERAVRPIDYADEDYGNDVKKGHRGIVSVNFDAKAASLTTMRVAYKEPENLGISVQGKRKETLIRLLYDEISKEVDDDFYPEPEATLYESVTHTDFDRKDGGKATSSDEQTKEKEEIVPESVYNEQPVTFWTENHNRITGVSQVKTGDTAFRKNTAFSSPIGEYWNQTQAYDIENYPKM